MTDIHTLRPKPDEFSYLFGGGEPLLRVKPGSIVEMYTEDCYGGRVTGPDTLPTEVLNFPYLNPVTGPIRVEGAEPGDVLAVHFVDIRPARDWAVSSTFPHFGALTGTHTTALLHDPLEERVWTYEIDVEKWTCRYRATRSDFTVELPLDPFHGTVGVAPDSFERFVTITPSFHGGNLDTPEMRAGTTLYLPVFVEGAMLAIGDGHSRQGEGEVAGAAVETAMNTVIAVDVVKGQSISSPRLQNDDFIMTAGSTKPLEDAYRISQLDLVTWTGDLLGLEKLDALQLVSQTCLVPTANVVDTNYTMVSKLSSSLLGGASVMDGAHARLRAIADEYRRHR